MNADVFQRARALFDEACDAAPEEQAAIIERGAGGDAEVQRLVEALLVEDQRSKLKLSAGGRAAHQAAPAPETIGPYRILRVVGQGGMGLVYEAVQESPRRRVAIKMIRAGSFSTEALRRFRYEAEILGRLQHPGIGQIFEAGSIDVEGGATPYFAMEFIEGLSLTEYADERDLTQRARLELVARVCDAVHYAHQRGVVHRDLKPDNIIVTSGESTSTSASTSAASIPGQPKILDFGIARATDADVHVSTMKTHAGQLIGTLQYMSPEQAVGNAANVDVRSDIYALGVILYELLSGRMPYDLEGRSIADSLRAVQEETPTRLGLHDTGLRGDVETIVGKCLEKEPERRYASASELAEDLRRHLGDQPIAARPPSAVYQLRKFARRNRALVGGLAATMVALFIGAVAATSFALRSNAYAESARWESYRARIVAANAVIGDDPAAAERYLDATPPELRGWEWRYLHSRLERHFMTFEAPRPWGPGLAPGAPIAFLGELVAGVIASADGTGPSRHIGLWSAADGKLTGTVEFSAAVSTFAVAAGERPRMAVGLVDGQVEVVEPLQPAERSVLRGRPLGADEPRVRALAWSPVGDAIAVGDASGVEVYEGGEVRRFGGDTTRFDGLVFSPDGAFLAQAVDQRYGSVAVFDVAAPERKILVSGDWVKEGPVRALFGATSKGLMVGTEHRIVARVDLEREGAYDGMIGHSAQVEWLARDPETGHFATSSFDGTLRVWVDGRTAAMLNAGEAARIAFAPGGESLAYSAGGRIRLWDMEDDLSVRLEDASSYVYHVAYSQDGRWLATSDFYGGETFLYDPRSGELVRRFDLGADVLTFTTDDELVICSRVYDLETGEFLRTFDDHPSWRRLHSGHVRSPDGSLRAAGKDRLTDYEMGEFVVTSEEGERVLEVKGQVFGAAFSPSGEWLALGHADGSVRIHEIAEGREIQRLAAHTGAAYAVDFHPDGRRLATGGNDGVVRLWDTATWEQVIELRGHESYVKALAFSPDGTQLTSGSGDSTVRVWDTVTAAERAAQVVRGETLAAPVERAFPASTAGTR